MVPRSTLCNEIYKIDIFIQKVDDARNETTISQNSLWIHWIFWVLGFLYLLNNHINVMYDLL